MLNSSFDSEFDEFDWYMIDLDAYDELTASLLYIDGYGLTDMEIYDKDDEDVTDGLVLALNGIVTWTC